MGLASAFVVYIRNQQEKTQEASDELKEASHFYELTPFNGMSKVEADVLEQRVCRSLERNPRLTLYFIIVPYI